MNKNEIPTPRTNVAIVKYCRARKLWPEFSNVVEVEDMEQLERELAQAKQREARLREVAESYVIIDEGVRVCGCCGGEHGNHIGACLVTLIKALSQSPGETMVPKSYLDAAMRLLANSYTPRQSAGGVNDCKHGYSEGIACPKCDAELLQSYAPKEKGQP